MSKIKECIPEGNEKFQKRKCAYFLPEIMGNGVLSTFEFVRLKEKKRKWA